jgi:hypothetical protein
MASLSKFRFDMDKSVQGVWVPFAADIEVKIARLYNPEFNRYYAEIREPHLTRLRNKNGQDKTGAELMKDAVANCIIKDWKNLQDDDGKTIKYSPEKALEIISDEANALFYDFILDVAGTLQFFFIQQKEQAVKN